MAVAIDDASTSAEATSKSSLVTTTGVERPTTTVETGPASSLAETTPSSLLPEADASVGASDRIGDVSGNSYRFTSSVTSTESTGESGFTILGEADGSGGYHFVYEPVGGEVIETLDGYWERLDGEWFATEPPREGGLFDPPDRYKMVYYMLEDYLEIAERVETESLGDGLVASRWHWEDDGEEPDGSQYHQVSDVWLDEISDGYHVVRAATWSSAWPDTGFTITYEWELRDLGAEIVIEPPIP